MKGIREIEFIRGKNEKNSKWTEAGTSFPNLMDRNWEAHRCMRGQFKFFRPTWGMNGDEVGSYNHMHITSRFSSFIWKRLRFLNIV